MTRRTWLSVTGLGLLVAPRPGLAQEPKTPPPPDPLAPLQAEAQKHGIGPLASHRAQRYLVAGDASPDFLQTVGKLCDDLAADYQRHFRSRGIPTDLPRERLVIIALASPASLARWTGQPIDDVTGGFYDPPSGRLLVYDQRGGAGRGTASERANTVVLMHEATHQLTFATGLLRPGATVPLAITEGLATYGETRRPTGKPGIGAINRERLAALAAENAQGAGWIPLVELLHNETLFADRSSEQRAYAQSWLFTYECLTQRTLLAGYLGFLSALRQEKASGARRDPATYLGSLDRLDTRLRDRAERLNRVRS